MYMFRLLPYDWGGGGSICLWIWICVKQNIVRILVGIFQECCFEMYANTRDLGSLQSSLPLAGTVVQYSPFFERCQYINNDSKPRDQCCSSGHCDLYYEVRPIPRCYRRSPFQPGTCRFSLNSN
jgi:hypothetical protein